MATVYAGSVVEHEPSFRPGNVLATSFTGTLTERCGEPVERIPTPARLLDWLGVYGFLVESCTSSQWEAARTLREAIHIAASAASQHKPLPEATVATINTFSSLGQASMCLTDQGERVWKLGSSTGMEDSLGVIAEDAISIISGDRDGRLALCASPTCRAAFFDTSRSRTRRWCDMNTCGNRQKKARFNATRQSS